MLLFAGRHPRAIGYGASAMFRDLSAWPVLPRMPDTGKLQIVQLDALVDTVVKLLPARMPA